MTELSTLREFLDGGVVDARVFSLRPDYRAVLPGVAVPAWGPAVAATGTKVLTGAPGPG